MGEHISLGICVSQVGDHISLGICVCYVGKHISLGICVSRLRGHILLGICVGQVGKVLYKKEYAGQLKQFLFPFLLNDFFHRFFFCIFPIMCRRQ